MTDEPAWQVKAQRQSFDGFDRKRLQGTLRVAMGVKSNADMFEGRGQSWHTTEAQQRKEAQERALLERQLRDSREPDASPYKPSQQRDLNAPQYKVIKPIEGKPTLKQSIEIERFILNKLADAGPPEPVKVDKQALAEQSKPKPPARRPRQGAYLKVALQVNRLAKLQRERDANERTGAVTADKRKEYGHFILERD